MSSSTARPASAITTTWPEGFDAGKPGVGGFAVREVEAPADAVFAWIRRVDLHPEFYRGMKFVKRLGGPWPALDKGTKLSFTLGATFIPYLQVIKCDPATRSLAWGGGVPGLSICHAWTVEPLSDTRSVIRSEELWVGPVARATGLLTKPQIQKVQTVWAEAIVKAATAHPAGPPKA